VAGQGSQDNFGDEVIHLNFGDTADQIVKEVQLKGPNPIFVKASEEGFAEWGEWFIKVLHDQGLQRLVGSQKQIYVGSSGLSASKKQALEKLTEFEPVILFDDPEDTESLTRNLFDDIAKIVRNADRIKPPAVRKRRFAKEEDHAPEEIYKVAMKYLHGKPVDEDGKHLQDLS
jgi:hypothetical protein